MKYRLKLLRIVLGSVRGIVLISLGTVYGFLFLAGLNGLQRSPETARDEILIAAQLFVPLGALLWEMIYFHLWVDDSGQEALRAIDKGKRTCLMDLLFLNVLYMGCMLPGVFLFCFFFGFWPMEAVRLAIEIMLAAGILYLFGILMHSVTLGGLPAVCYLLFSSLSAMDARMQILCPLQAQVPVSRERFFEIGLPALLIVGLFFLGGWLAERYLYKIYR